MFSRKREPSSLDRETDRALSALGDHSVGSKEYAETLETVSKLHKMQSESYPAPVSKDTILIVAANLLGILMVLRYENVNVITSRAMNMVVNPRLPRS